MVLLPGFDGTGRLFARFRAALPETLTTSTVAYPPEKFLPYSELPPFVRAAVPDSSPFVLLAESFSAPIALEFAATNPPNLAAVIVCFGFDFKPLGIL